MSEGASISAPPTAVPGSGRATQNAGYISKYDKAEKLLVEDPYDLEAWGMLIRETPTMNEEDARNIFERLTNQFPTCGKYWKGYIDFEIKLQNYELAEKLFQKCLTKVLNLELWKSYLAYVRETKNSLPNFKENMASAYDFALDKVGTDIMAYTIWNDYLIFLKGIEAQGTYAENQKITAVRRIYQRGCMTPLINVDTLWKEYQHFENNVNPLLAKKILEEKMRDYIKARSVAREYEALTRNLVRNSPAVPPRNTQEERSQLDYWRKYFAWEKGNPLNSEDCIFVSKRVMYAYEQCLLLFGHHPDIWYEACLYLETVSKVLQQKGDANNARLFSDEVCNLYERALAIHLMRRSHILYFAYADYEETRMRVSRVHSIYERALAIADMDPTLTYIQYMRFARRAEGIKSARTVFKRAREDRRSGPHIYVVAALMEYYCSKDQNVAYKIFELGLRKHQEDTQYILAYLDFLSHLNEQNNTRVLFEKALTSRSPEKNLEIWENYISFESMCGDLASIQKVERRRLSTFPETFEGRETKMLVDRYKFNELVPVSEDQLRAMQYQTALPHIHKVMKNIGQLGSGVEGGELNRQHFPLPDPCQMIPFKPSRHPSPESLCVPGGDFPIPPAAESLMKRLPPPNCFQGPFVVLDEFLKQMLDINLPDVESAGDGEGGGRGTKRTLAMDDDDSDDENDRLVAPSSDIYRQRQQMRTMGLSGPPGMH